MIKNIKDIGLISFLTQKKFKNLFFLFFIFIALFSFFNYVTINLASHKSDNFSKEKFYDDRVFDVVSSLKDNRTFEGFEGGHSRHKLRWLFRDLESKIYENVFKITKSKPLIIFSFLNTLYVYFSFIFTYLTIKSLRKSFNSTDLILSGFIFYTLICLKFSYGYQTPYSVTEMLFISMGIYYSLNSKILIFLIVMFFAVINRESGIAISLIYIIFNHRKLYSYFLPFLAIIILLVVNFDLVQNINIYKFSTYFPVNENYFEKESESFKHLIIFFIYILSFFVMFFSFVKFSTTYSNQNKLLMIFLLYSLIALFGTNLTNIFSLILTIPSFTILFSLSYDNDY